MTSAWNEEWRRRRLPALAGQEWDLIVVGGGISGAGILREAARRGWRCLLLEQRDFAWGTSSRSSKMPPFESMPPTMITTSIKSLGTETTSIS